MTDALTLVNVRQRFGATEVLRGVSLSVKAGERVALIGPNGAGKSTLFNLISGRTTLTCGEVWLRGQRIDGQAPHAVARCGLARSFQVSQVFARLTVHEHLRAALLAAQGWGLRLWCAPAQRRAIEAQADVWLQRLHLAAQRNTPAAALSYAEQRALELGLTLASGAPVLLLDEPTAGMSRSEAAHAVALIRELTVGRSVLIVEHDMQVVFELADRIAVLVAGEVIALDTPDAVRANPLVQAAYLGAYLGAPVSEAAP
ncbi:MAG: hypothetical protein RJA98_4162 [Pseudomonadota bacterium]|jgi:branched-chain amino acid transport system ATP-binding protein